MFEKTLSKNTKKALVLLGHSHLLDHAYLAGGTACALQLGHRISVDLDFFTEKEFDAKATIQQLQGIGCFELEQESWGTILGYMEKVRFSLFVYQYPVLFETKDFHGVQLLDLRDIAAMKVDAISSRGIKRDFIDLYYICQEKIVLKEILKFYDQKYRNLASNLIHIRKSLVYFVDAEASEPPKMIKPIKWEIVKSFFEGEVKKIF